jgi:molybdenum cofactor cytidylyltransferase
VASTGIIILAAGSSSRLGSSKQLINYQGKTLLERIVNLSAEVNPLRTVVVLGADYEIHRRAINDYQVDVIINEHWQKGIGSSIKKGLDALIERTPEITSVMITVCDQPYLASTHLRGLIEMFSNSGKAIVASTYGGNAGVPAIFAKSVFNELKSIGDETGAKKIIDRDHSRVAFIAFERGDIDIDTPDDLSRLRSSNH